MRKAPLRRPDSPLPFLWETRKGGGGISLSGEAKDMMAASKQLAGGSTAPSREHLVAKPDLSR